MAAELEQVSRPSREDLAKAIADLKEDELKEMGKRLAKSHDDLAEMLTELEAERKKLQEDNLYYRNTIELMMKELSKLNIGASNTVDPMLEEGPLDFVGRFWEKVRPRDTAVVVSEHVGEIKKPGLAQEGSSPNARDRLGSGAQAAQQRLSQVGQQVGQQAQQVGQQVGQQAQQVMQQVGPQAQQVREQAVEKAQQAQQASKEAVEKVGAALGPLWQRAQGSIGAVQGFWNAGANATGDKPKKERKKKDKQASGYDQADAAPTAPDTASGAEIPAGAAADGFGEGAQAAAEAPETAADEAALAEEQVSSTILIEALLKLDDGSVQTLHVRAADRCKEVAHRFVQEHSLKQWFEEPLTAWLKKVEADAVKFPVKLEGDILEIRKLHAKK